MNNLAALATVVLFASTGAGFAAENQDEAKKLKDSGKILPLEQLLQQARRDRPGRVVETELENKSGRYIYEIKIVDEKGVVQELEYDAQNGERLKEKQDN